MYAIKECNSSRFGGLNRNDIGEWNKRQWDIQSNWNHQSIKWTMVSKYTMQKI